MSDSFVDDLAKRAEGQDAELQDRLDLTRSRSEGINDEHGLAASRKWVAHMRR